MVGHPPTGARATTLEIFRSDPRAVVRRTRSVAVRSGDGPEAGAVGQSETERPSSNPSWARIWRSVSAETGTSVVITITAERPRVPSRSWW